MRLIPAAILAAMAAVPAHAVSVTPSTDASALASAIFGATPGISIVPGSASFIGTSTQQGLYSGFNLSAPDRNTLTLGDGVVLTTGTTAFSLTENTQNSFDAFAGTGSNADLSAILSAAGLNSTTNDQNVLTFQFTAAPGINSISGQFIFVTEEFPTQGVTDVLGVFVDGTNYAFFPDGSLVSNQSGVTDGFFNENFDRDEFGNPVVPPAEVLYPIEWNGLTNSLTVTGLLDMSLDVHTFTLAIADTSDTIYDSGVFFSGLIGGVVDPGDGGGVIVTPPGGGGGDNGGGVAPIPVPASLPLMMVAGAALVAARRRKAAA
jgi:hypothetical protein